jgi:PAS domain S-box-containing protein
VKHFVVRTSALALLAVAIVVVASRALWGGFETTFDQVPAFAAFAAAVVFTLLGQLAYVRVPHGDTWEELNFIEVTLAVGILVLAPTTVLCATLTGVAIGELALRRAWIKAVFNLSSYAVATSAMIATYHVLLPLLSSVTGEEQGPTTWASMISLVCASGVFTSINLALMAQLVHRTAGVSPRQVWRDEGRLSQLMTLGAVGMAFMAVVAALEAPAALPFAFLPAIALWFAYSASADHAAARERNRWLVELGGHLAGQGGGNGTLAEATHAVRRIVGAPESIVLEPGTQTDPTPTALLAALADSPGPRAMASHELPAGWQTGVVTRMDLGGDEPGALLLGSTEPYRPSRIVGRTRGWSIEEADAPVLGALVAAVGSAMRAGAAFATLTEERDKLTAVVDNTSDGIAMVDDSGRVRLWSQTMVRMTGVRAEELGEDLPGAPIAVQALVRAACSDHRFTPVRLSVTRGDGETLDVSVTTTRVREAAISGDGEQGFVNILTVHDETRERRVERMKSDFIASVSHELRTPITPIKGYAHLLASHRNRMDPDKVTQKLLLIAHSADHLERLVDDLLTAQHLSGRAQLGVIMGVHDISAVVSQAVDGFPQIADRITVALPELPVDLQCDRDRTVQCLANLIGNADKYAPGSPIDITVQVDQTHAHIHVRDHGPGIPVDDRDRVFTRFYRREDPLTMRTRGAGLGLHIARELTESMGGGLTLQEPEDGVGAEFVLHLLTTQAPSIVDDAHEEDPQAAAAPAIRRGQAWRLPRSQQNAARHDTAAGGDPAAPVATGDGIIGPSAHEQVVS